MSNPFEVATIDTADFGQFSPELELAVQGAITLPTARDSDIMCSEFVDTYVELPLPIGDSSRSVSVARSFIGGHERPISTSVTVPSPNDPNVPQTIHVDANGLRISELGEVVSPNEYGVSEEEILASASRHILRGVTTAWAEANPAYVVSPLADTQAMFSHWFRRSSRY